MRSRVWSAVVAGSAGRRVADVAAAMLAGNGRWNRSRRNGNSAINPEPCGSGQDNGNENNEQRRCVFLIHIDASISCSKFLFQKNVRAATIILYEHERIRYIICVRSNKDAGLC